MPGSAFIPAEFGRNLPTWVDARHVGQQMGNSLGTVDAGSLAGHKETAVNFSRTLGLSCEIHGDCRMAVAALKRVICLEPGPFMLGQFAPLLQERLPCRNRPKNLSPNFLR